MDDAETTAQLTEGTILEGPHWTEPVRVLTAKPVAAGSKSRRSARSPRSYGPSC